MVVTCNGGQRSCNPQVERVLADALAVENPRMIGLSALAHEDGIPGDVDQCRIIKMNQPCSASYVDPPLNQRFVGFSVRIADDPVLEM